MEIITIKVNKCLDEYMGGEQFFDELDKTMKFDKEILETLLCKISVIYGYKGIHTISSGEFGLCLHNYKLPVDIIVQGGLRKGNEILDLSSFITPGDKYVFLDDSYYSGATAEIVKQEVERNQGEFLGCLVVYDGSKEPVHQVASLYKYYDHH